jgi:hypothetical protein
MLLVDILDKNETFLSPEQQCSLGSDLRKAIRGFFESRREIGG